ncbi:hypothetical protein [Streptomyces sp. NPDC004546]|uniref:hypothetical protein n=1 Tax=Streptomyces sp. NPDC004546 TaxID=3154282 RepID=UPI0033B568D4
MADEKDSDSGSILRRPWDLMVSTVVWELFGLAVCGVVALVFWPFGGPPDSSFFLAIPALFAAGPVGELYRTGPPRRLAAAVALLATMTVITLFGAAAGWAFPPLADHKIGLLAGFFVGAPVGAGVFAWYSNGAKGA